MTDDLVREIAAYLALNNSTSAGLPDAPENAVDLWPSYRGQALQVIEMVNTPALAALQAVKDYVSHQPLDLKKPSEIQSELLAIVALVGGEE